MALRDCEQVSFVEHFRSINSQLRLPSAVTSLVSEEVRLRPGASERVELLFHVVDIDFVDLILELGPSLHKIIAPLPSFL